MAVAVQEYEALLPAGLHAKSFQELKTICVDSFAPISAKREILLNNLCSKILTPLSSTGVRCNVWIDGSFLTKKTEPNDIDLVIECPNSIPPLVGSFLNDVIDNVIFKITYLLDVYAFVKDDTQSRSYWKGQFGFGRDDSPKGIISININGGI
jgi:hypothetical protein